MIHLYEWIKILVQDSLRSWGYSDWHIAPFIVFVVKVHYIVQKKEIMVGYSINELDNKWESIKDSLRSLKEPSALMFSWSHWKWLCHALRGWCNDLRVISTFKAKDGKDIRPASLGEENSSFSLFLCEYMVAEGSLWNKWSNAIYSTLKLMS